MAALRIQAELWHQGALSRYYPEEILEFIFLKALEKLIE